MMYMGRVFSGFCSNLATSDTMKIVKTTLKSLQNALPYIVFTNSHDLMTFCENFVFRKISLKIREHFAKGFGTKTENPLCMFFKWTFLQRLGNVPLRPFSGFHHLNATQKRKPENVQTKVWYWCKIIFF